MVGYLLSALHVICLILPKLETSHGLRSQVGFKDSHWSLLSLRAASMITCIHSVVATLHAIGSQFLTVMHCIQFVSASTAHGFASHIYLIPSQPLISHPSA